MASAEPEKAALYFCFVANPEIYKAAFSCLQMIIKTYQTADFLTLSNATCRDRRLLPESSGLLLHILSYSREFEATEKKLQEIFGIGAAKLEKIVNDLKTYGYLEIERGRDDLTGLFFWQWNFFDISRKPEVEKIHRAKKALWMKTQEKTPENPIKSIGRKSPHGPQGENHPMVFKRNDLKTTSKGIKKTKKKDANSGGADSDAKNQNSGSSAPFALFANICFAVPFEKAEFVSGAQREKIETAISELANLDAGFLDSLPFFGDYWRNDWKSLDKKFSKYQEPRPEQIPEFWFRFISSAFETDRRQALETNFENKKEVIKNGKTNGNRQYDDFSRFDNLEFGE